MDPSHLRDDFRDFLTCLNEAGVEHLVVGAENIQGRIRPGFFKVRDGGNRWAESQRHFPFGPSGQQMVLRASESLADVRELSTKP
jgi:hypothetical protein